MKYLSFVLLLVSVTFFSCEKDDDNGKSKEVKNITLSIEGAGNPAVGKEVTFLVKGDNDVDLTDKSDIFVDGKKLVDKNRYVPTKAGKINAYAQYENLKSSTISLDVQDAPVQGSGSFTQKVLIHDFTGTWCGYCAETIFEIENLHKKYPNIVVPVSVHTGSGPENDGTFDYEKYDVFKVEGNPIIWFNNRETEGNIDLLTKELLNHKKNIGLAINYDLKNEKVAVKVGYDQVSSNHKIVVYLLEDKLIASQANYGNNNEGSLTYQKGDPIQNLEHNNILRTALTEPLGNPIPDNEIKNKVYTVEYSLGGKMNKVLKKENTKIVAFVIDSEGNAVNAQVAKTDENVNFD